MGYYDTEAPVTEAQADDQTVDALEQAETDSDLKDTGDALLRTAR